MITAVQRFVWEWNAEEVATDGHAADQQLWVCGSCSISAVHCTVSAAWQEESLSGQRGQPVREHVPRSEGGRQVPGNRDQNLVNACFLWVHSFIVYSTFHGQNWIFLLKIPSIVLSKNWLNKLALSIKEKLFVPHSDLGMHWKYEVSQWSLGSRTSNITFRLPGHGRYCNINWQPI